MNKTVVTTLSLFLLFCIFITSCSNSGVNDHSAAYVSDLPNIDNSSNTDNSSNIQSERPSGIVYVNFSNWNELFLFLDSVPKVQLQMLEENNFSVEDIEVILAFADKIKETPLPVFDRSKDVEYIMLTCYPGLDDRISVFWEDAAYHIDYPLNKFADNVQMGNIDSYYQNAYPGLPRPNSYDESSYKMVEFVDLDRDDMSSGAILIVPQYSAPRITVMYNDVILTFSIFGQGMGTTELIEMVNTADIENMER